MMPSCDEAAHVVDPLLRAVVMARDDRVVAVLAVEHVRA